MFHERLVSGIQISFQYCPNHLLVIVPNRFQIGEICVEIETNNFIGVPIRFEQSDDKGVLQAAEDCEMQIAVLFMGNARW